MLCQDCQPSSYFGLSENEVGIHLLGEQLPRFHRMLHRLTSQGAAPGGGPGAETGDERVQVAPLPAARSVAAAKSHRLWKVEEQWLCRAGNAKLFLQPFVGPQGALLISSVVQEAFLLSRYAAPLICPLHRRPYPHRLWRQLAAHRDRRPA